MSAATVPSDRRHLGDLAPRLFGLGLALGVVGLLTSLLVAMLADHGWERFFRSYVVAFMFGLSICLGGLFWTAIQFAVRAGWGVVLRRISEAAMSNLRWVWILFIPIAIGMLMSDKTHLYHWAMTGAENDPLLLHKNPYLNKPFWLIRAALFFTIWAGIATFYCRMSVAQDARGDVSYTKKMQWFAPLTLLLYALTQSYASIDWIKSLEAHWFSTMFGVYFFAATATGFFAFQILAVFFLQRRGRLINEITLEHYQDMGKLLFAFGVVFWAYIAFSQFMLIWYGNLPEETIWYMARQLGPWLAVTLLLLFGHFIVPFVVLISKYPKRIKAVLAGIAAWMLLMHFIDVYWMAMPQVPIEAIEAATSYAALAEQAKMGLLDLGYGWHILDLTCLVMVLGFLLAGTTRWLSQCALIPIHDPRLHESLAFENM